jgi:hypothetical protein
MLVDMPGFLYRETWPVLWPIAIPFMLLFVLWMFLVTPPAQWNKRV